MQMIIRPLIAQSETKQSKSEFRIQHSSTKLATMMPMHTYCRRITTAAAKVPSSSHGSVRMCDTSRRTDGYRRRCADFRHSAHPATNQNFQNKYLNCRKVGRPLLVISSSPNAKEPHLMLQHSTTCDMSRSWCRCRRRRRRCAHLHQVVWNK